MPGMNCVAPKDIAWEPCHCEDRCQYWKEAPVRAATTTAHLPITSDARKNIPLATGLLDYFPDALAAVARLSKIGNDKHNPGEPLHWSREKSSDHADCIMRHMLDRGTVDEDGELHDVKVAWRALAQLQVALEKQKAKA